MKFKFRENWKHFERVIAAIHSAEMAGATVVLNEKIGGREFDVSVRFKSGFHNYLTLIECKRYSEHVSVEKVEAFVTKSRDAGANKAIMFSSSGFQSGAISTAKKHGVDLYTVFEEIRIPEEIKAGGTTEGISICDLLVKINGIEFSLPQENGRMEYLMRKSILTYGSEKTTIDEFILRRKLELYNSSAYTEKERYYPMLSGVKLTVPGLWDNEEVEGIKVIYKKMDFVNIKGDVPLVDDHLFEKMHTYYCMKNEVTGEDTSIMAIGVHLGFDTKIEAGKFYSNPQLGNNYFIESIDNELALIYLLESYVKGNLIQAVYYQDVKYQNQYVIINDEDEIERLSQLYRKMKEK